MTVDDVVEALFRVLCEHQRAKGPEADMSLAELRLALRVTEAQLMEAVRVLRFSSGLFIAFTTQAWDRVTLGCRRGGSGARTSGWREHDRTTKENMMGRSLPRSRRS